MASSSTSMAFLTLFLAVYVANSVITTGGDGAQKNSCHARGDCLDYEVSAAAASTSNTMKPDKDGGNNDCPGHRWRHGHKHKKKAPHHPPPPPSATPTEPPPPAENQPVPPNQSPHNHPPPAEDQPVPPPVHETPPGDHEHSPSPPNGPPVLPVPPPFDNPPAAPMEPALPVPSTPSEPGLPMY